MAIYKMTRENLQAALDDGCVWVSGDKGLNHLDYNYLRVSKDKNLSCFIHIENTNGAKVHDTYPTLLKNKPMTLDELSKVEGAFDVGNEYECVVSVRDVYTKGMVYKANGKGILDNFSDSIILKDSYCNTSDGSDRPKFKKVEKTTKRYWNGKEKIEVGMIVSLYSNNEAEVKLPQDGDGHYVVLRDDGKYFFAISEELIPVDILSNRERFVDSVYRSDLSVKESLALAYDILKGEK